MSATGRPTAEGEIIDNKGYVNYPDDRTYAFEYDPHDKTIYWEGRNSGSKWVKTTLDSDNTGSNNLRRPEIIALIHTVHKLSESIHYYQEFLKAEGDENFSAAVKKVIITLAFVISVFGAFSRYQKGYVNHPSESEIRRKLDRKRRRERKNKDKAINNNSNAQTKVKTD